MSELIERETPTNPLQLLQSALDTGVDPERLTQLMDLHDRWQEGQAKQAYYDAMRQAQLELPVVVRDAENKQTNSRYSRLETLSRAIDPVIHKHGFAVSFGTGESNLERHIRITASVMHSGGHRTEHFLDLPIDDEGLKGTKNKTGTHAAGSTFTYGRRYLKCLIFDVTIANEDNDGNRVPVLTEQQARLIQDLLDTREVDLEKFWKWTGVDRVTDLPFDKFSQAKEMLQSKPRKEQDDEDV